MCVKIAKTSPEWSMTALSPVTHKIPCSQYLSIIDKVIAMLSCILEFSGPMKCPKVRMWTTNAPLFSTLTGIALSWMPRGVWHESLFNTFNESCLLTCCWPLRMVETVNAKQVLALTRESTRDCPSWFCRHVQDFWVYWPMTFDAAWDVTR